MRAPAFKVTVPVVLETRAPRMMSPVVVRVTAPEPWAETGVATVREPAKVRTAMAPLPAVVRRSDWVASVTGSVVPSDCTWLMVAEVPVIVRAALLSREMPPEVARAESVATVVSMWFVAVPTPTPAQSRSPEDWSVTWPSEATLVIEPAVAVREMFTGVEISPPRMIFVAEAKRTSLPAVMLEVAMAVIRFASRSTEPPVAMFAFCAMVAVARSVMCPVPVLMSALAVIEPVVLRRMLPEPLAEMAVESAGAVPLFSVRSPPVLTMIDPLPAVVRRSDWVTSVTATTVASAWTCWIVAVVSSTTRALVSSRKMPPEVARAETVATVVSMWFVAVPTPTPAQSRSPEDWSVTWPSEATLVIEPAVAVREILVGVEISPPRMMFVAEAKRTSLPAVMLEVAMAVIRFASRSTEPPVAMFAFCAMVAVARSVTWPVPELRSALAVIEPVVLRRMLPEPLAEMAVTSAGAVPSFSVRSPPVLTMIDPLPAVVRRSDWVTSVTATTVASDRTF